MERPIEGGQGARVCLCDHTEQDRISKRRAKSDHNRKYVQVKNDFVERDGGGDEHGQSLLVISARA
jgi:hypothetical protein